MMFDGDARRFEFLTACHMNLSMNKTLNQPERASAADRN